MIYLDNAATSFPKPTCVYKAVKKALEKYCANPGRSSHYLSSLAQDKVFEAREVIAEHFSLRSESCVAFCSNATEALNTAIKGLIHEPCNVIISDFEHNSVLRPLYSLRDRVGIELSEYDTDKDIESELLRLIKPNTRYIVTGLRSNVTGKEIDYTVLGRIAKSYNITVIADATQLVGHRSIDLSTSDIDVLCTAGHKGLLGIQGTGLLLINRDINILPLKEGGTGYDSLSPYMPERIPEKFEAGTLNLPGIVSMTAGIKYLNSLGYDEIERTFNRHEALLNEAISSVTEAKIYGSCGGIISFNLNGLDSYQVAEELNKQGICVRGGLHCAPSIHKKLGTEKIGAVRVSTGLLNTRNDIERLYKVLKSIKR